MSNTPYRTGPVINFDLWAMSLAAAASEGADCSRRMVGAVLTKGSQVLAVGFNAAPEGEVGCLAGGCPRASSGVPAYSSYDTGAGACISVHAEQRVLLQVSAEAASGATLYCTEKPCDGCSRMIRDSGVVRWRSPNHEWRKS